MATQDADQWVSMIGEILKTFPSMGTLNLDLEDNGIFSDMTSDLNKAGEYQMAWFMVFNTTFNNISVISWQSVLLMEETRVPGENH